MEDLEGAKGRLEFVGRRGQAPIFIDYAHKPDALSKTLEALRPYVKKRLIVVFGAGGNRDPGKRPMMGAIAAREGGQGDRHRRQSAQRGPGRRSVPRSWPRRPAPSRSPIAAPRSAQSVASLENGDVLVIAGKGHESGQIVGDRVLEFSDHDAVAAALGGKAR